MMHTSDPGPLSRRDVLMHGGMALAASALTPFALGAPGALRPGEKRRIGLVGCGGRGGGAAANALRADPDNVLVALGDLFPDMLQNTLNGLSGDAELAPRIDVPAERQFVGFEAYKQVVDSCDVVLFCTTPHFRPMHVEYAVQQGKHMFVEKPVAIDAPGLRRIWAASDEAKRKGLTLVSGLCYRYEKKKQETVKRVHEGAIGDIVALECSYNTGGLWHRGRKDNWSDMEWQIRNWLYHTWLSGDHVMEQAIHNLDKIAWVMGDKPPASVDASGGRIVRTDPIYGNVFDHFNARFTWEGGLKCFFSCRQWSGAKPDVSDHVYGTKGVAHIQSHKIEGENPWRWRTPEGMTDDMYQNEHNELFQALREGRQIHNGDYMCQSTLMALMTRMSAYTGQEISWTQALESQEDLSPAAYEWGDIAVGPIAQPGVTKFV
ncbi:MAG: Gfo/Idh/MocA family oxidoreductase [Planctomycetota bacterium]